MATQLFTKAYFSLGAMKSKERIDRINIIAVKGKWKAVIFQSAKRTVRVHHLIEIVFLAAFKRNPREIMVHRHDGAVNYVFNVDGNYIE